MQFFLVVLKVYRHYFHHVTVAEPGSGWTYQTTSLICHMQGSFFDGACFSVCMCGCIRTTTSFLSLILSTRVDGQQLPISGFYWWKSFLLFFTLSLSWPKVNVYKCIYAHTQTLAIKLIDIPKKAEMCHNVLPQNSGTRGFSAYKMKQWRLVDETSMRILKRMIRYWAITI